MPTLIVCGAAVLALGLIEVDQQLDQELRDKWPRLFAAEAEGSRAMLTAIASSMITVAGVVFSITIVALALAASQYTSRILRNFMRDRANQVVLGVFVGVFTYCLLVLRIISSGNTDAFVPALAVVGGVILALISIGFLIFFIHHIATSIQASEIIAGISKETIEAVDRLFPQELGEEGEEATDELHPPIAEMTWQVVPALTTGYIQRIEADMLLRFAREQNTVVRMELGIGEFVAQGSPLASLALDRPPDTATVKALNTIYAIDSYRTVDQDAAFGIRQLVDMALKALSPGINDTTTAVTCVDYLSVILLRCASRHIEPPYRFDKGELRVIARGPTFEGLLNQSFDQILENAEGNTVVLTRILSAIEHIYRLTRSTQRRRALMRQVQMIAELADRIKSTQARRAIEAHLMRIKLK